MNYKELDIDKLYLVTGVAGFIGAFLAMKLLAKGCFVVGIDNLNDYYDVNLKHARLNTLKPYKNFTFIKCDISEKDTVMGIFNEYRPNVVVNLAAQAGVRYSIENPDIYIQSNIIGFFNILESCRKYRVDHLVYASSSSVYGTNKKVPFEETDFVDHPISLYAATKKSNELMAFCYSYLYGIPATGLRFFTVYGPMGRPDMAYFSFTSKYFKGEPIHIYNNGNFDNDLYRDFTYIDDVIEGILRLLGNPPNSSADVPNKVYNIGNSSPEKLMVFINTLEKALSKASGHDIIFEKIFKPNIPGDVSITYASTELLQDAVGFRPKTTIEIGLQNFADWYIKYYKLH